MLLDFNLAKDSATGDAAAARIGGTLPYMAPEHLDAFRGGKGTIDARSDIYSLGLVLFELMTRRSAFVTPIGPLSVLLPAMLSDQHKGAPSARSINPSISPAASEIIAKCLCPNPADRYQSAADLKEDVERHLADLPLRHAKNPSFRERVQKWARRHPRLTSTSTTVGAALLLLLGCGFVAFGAMERQQRQLRQLAERQAKTEAIESFELFEKNRHLQLALAYAYDPDTAALERIVAHSAETLRPYELSDRSTWESNNLVRHLDPASRDRLKLSVAEVALTGADALLLHAERTNNPDRRSSDLAEAQRLNEFASTLQLGRSENKGEQTSPAKGPPQRTTRDLFQLAGRHMRRLEFTEALPLLKEVTRQDPNHLWAWFAQGNCLHQLLQYEAAVACYSTCLALAPDVGSSFFPLINRSKSYYALGRRSEAMVDIDRAVEVAQDLRDREQGFESALARFQRAAYREQQRDLDGAKQDLTVSIESSALKIQSLLARSRVRGLLKDDKGARADRDEALQLTPRDEAGWNDRGLARIADDPLGALADFEEALKINSRYYPSMQNKAHVLSESLDKPAESIRVLGQLLELYPGFVEARIGRAVLLARQGKRQEAHAETIRALAKNPKAIAYYQAANVYALTAKIEPTDAERVPVLMAFALLAGFGDDVIDSDSDMDPVRKKTGFLDTLRIVRMLRKEIGLEVKK